MTGREVRDRVLRSLFWDKQVEDYFRKFQAIYPDYTRNNRMGAVKYIIQLNRAQYMQQSLNSVNKPKNIEMYMKQAKVDFRYFMRGDKRENIDDFVELLSQYDVISFDIFDTALYRKVEFPNNVFDIMSIKMGHNDFTNIRKKAESYARECMEKLYGTREVTLSQIYDVLVERYNIDRKWENVEIELEKQLLIANPFIKEVYEQMRSKGKIIVFMSDMYLPQNVLESILHQNGYEGFEKLYLSNEYKLRKGDGTLQVQLLNDYEGKRIVHIGDFYDGDVKKSIDAGLAAIYNPSANMNYREPNMDCLSGSFYRALINNTLNNGLWDKSLHFEHGFRVGGILATGFCQYINEVAKRKKIEKILFCARDCEIISKIYNKFFKEFENEYIEISRYALLNVVNDRYLYDIVNRIIIRHAEENKSSKTIENVLIDTGYDYLVPCLEESEIDKFLFPSAIGKEKIEKFIFANSDVIRKNNLKTIEAAKKYYEGIIGNAENILIVDIGWSGTCITALKYFLEKQIQKEYQISGLLMCTSRNKAVTNSFEEGIIDSYIYNPFTNMDLTRFMMPANTSNLCQDLLHMPLEYLFTSTKRSLAGYAINADGNISFGRTGIEPRNVEEINDIHNGMLAFVEDFLNYTNNFRELIKITPYVAFNPLAEAIRHRDYSYAVYRNFIYDASTAPYEDRGGLKSFGDLFDVQTTNYIEKNTENGQREKRILFVTPELVYTGAPRSLLRMCRVAIELGYKPVVWSAKSGSFITEYENWGIDVSIIPENYLSKKEIREQIKSYDMAVCNTIVTDKYAKVCSYYIPTIWYIREATNIPDFCKNNPERLFLLKHSKDLCCVSDYAEKAIRKYAKHKIKIVHNSVEEETDLALPYAAGTNEKVRFVQFGTMEYRKGYDVLLAAYKEMPRDYQQKAEVYFAGGFINSGSPYCSYLFGNMKEVENVHYLGVIKGEQKKIETLSQMDVIVVASRDESCSLVALEGAMLSKPLIVTENVGAKYMVRGDNGIIVNTDDVVSLKKAMMYMIDHKEQLEEMGQKSRSYYDKYASMDSYREELRKLYSLTNRKGRILFKINAINNRIVFSPFNRNMQNVIYNRIRKITMKKNANVIVSLTSHPGRIDVVSESIKSLLKQSVKPKKILLWLSISQFPNKESDLPEDIINLKNYKNFEIRWVDGDLAPHKKYYYAMQEYSELPIIIVDDDVIYDSKLVEKLMESYKKHPDCISCMRGNMMMFKEDGKIRPYEGWLLGYEMLLDTPSYQIMPTGVGGVLYPPHALPDEAFDVEAIRNNCLYCDDLWLKIMAVHNGYKTVIPRDFCRYQEIEESQKVALWRKNVYNNNNDNSLGNILNYYINNITKEKDILGIIRADRFS